MERDLVMLRVSGMGYLAPVDLDIDPDPIRGAALRWASSRTEYVTIRHRGGWWRSSRHVIVVNRWVRSTSSLSQDLLVGVAVARYKTVFDAQHFGADGLVVVVVEPFDNLKGPPTFENVTADNVLPQRVSLLAVSTIGQQQRALLEEKIGPPYQLMKRIQMTAGSLDILECLCRLAHRVNGPRLDTFAVCTHGCPLVGRTTLFHCGVRTPATGAMQTIWSTEPASGLFVKKPGVDQREVLLLKRKEQQPIQGTSDSRHPGFQPSGIRRSRRPSGCFMDR
jgi:hypothetical protein